MTTDQIRRLLWRWIYERQGDKPTDRDYVYWGVEEWGGLVDRGNQIGYRSPVDGYSGGLAYARDRVYGWQATGVDIPPYGPWADPSTPQFKSKQFFSPVPAYPGDVVDPPIDPPVDPPVNPPTLPILDQFAAKLDAQTAAIVSLAAVIAQVQAQLARGFTNRFIGAVEPKK